MNGTVYDDFQSLNPNKKNTIDVNMMYFPIVYVYAFSNLIKLLITRVLKSKSDDDNGDGDKNKNIQQKTNHVHQFSTILMTLRIFATQYI